MGVQQGVIKMKRRSPWGLSVGVAAKSRSATPKAVRLGLLTSLTVP